MFAMKNNFKKVAWNMDRETIDDFRRVETNVLKEVFKMHDRGEFEAAVDAINASASEETISGDTSALVARALAHFGCGNMEDAHADLDRAEHRLKTMQGVIQYNRAALLCREQRYGEARSVAERGFELSGERWDMGAALMVACELDGDGGAAEDVLLRVARRVADEPAECRAEIVAYMTRHADLDALRSRVNLLALFDVSEKLVSEKLLKRDDVRVSAEQEAAQCE